MPVEKHRNREEQTQTYRTSKNASPPRHAYANLSRFNPPSFQNQVPAFHGEAPRVPAPAINLSIPPIQIRPPLETELKLAPEFPGPSPEDESPQKQIEADQGSVETPINYGQWLSNELKQRGWSVRQLAAMLDVPVAQILRWGKNRSYPGFSFRQQIADLFANQNTEALQEPTKQAPPTDKQTGHDERKLQIQINTPQLTAQNFTTIFSSITELHTKCWLIQQGRFADVVEYTRTHSIKFAQEANLQITQLTYNSPLYASLEPGTSTNNKPLPEPPIKLRLAFSPQDVVEAVIKSIQAIIHIKPDYEAKQLKNEEMRTAIKQREQEAESKNEREQIELERLKLVYQRELLELEAQKVETILKTANTVVTMLAPDTPASDQMKTILVQALIPTLTQLGSGQGLQLALPVAHSH